MNKSLQFVNSLHRGWFFYFPLQNIITLVFCECRPNNFGRKLLEMCKSALAIFEKYCHHWKLKVNLQKTKVIIFCNIQKSFIWFWKNLKKNPVLALKSPTSAHFMSFSIKFTNSFSISKNAFIDEYREKSALAIFEKYCHHWKLKVNLQKTKVIIFCKRK
jgi:dihydroneopterin aldolase